MIAIGALDRAVLAFKALMWSNDKPKLSHRYPVSKQKRERTVLSLEMSTLRQYLWSGSL